MAAKLRQFFVVALISIIPTLLVWFPFFFRLETVWGIPLPRDGMATIVANYDGPLYIVVAKSLYNTAIINTFSFSLPALYYAAHFPLYPLLIRIFALIFGFPYSMLFVTVASSVLATYFFYLFARDHVDKKNALWMAMVFALLPARWLIVRSVGSPEPLFLAGIIASFYYFKKEKYLWAGVWGAVAQLTKSPAILVFVAYFLAISIPKFKNAATTSFTKKASPLEIKKYLSILLIPLSLLLIFYIYKIQLNDFFAYFHSGDNIHLFFPPFQIFNYSQPWVGTFWLEEVIFVYLFAILGLIKLVKLGEKELAWFVGIFFSSIIFVSHRDIIRYALPVFPFLLVAFADTINTKEFKIAMAVLAIPIYLFSLTYISQNVMPIPDWAPLL
jgi:hypothetical protein